MRICFFGDSIINGTGDDDGLGWVGRVVAQARRGGSDLTAYNLGIRRDTSGDVAARWMQEARLRLPAEDDCRLVFSFGANDCTDNGKGGPRVELAESLGSARAILVAARDWLPTLMLGPAIIADSDDASRRVVALSAEFARLCASLSIPYLDLTSITSGSQIWVEEALAGDGAHPSSGGYSVIAEAVARWPAWRAWVAPSASRLQ